MRVGKPFAVDQVPLPAACRLWGPCREDFGIVEVGLDLKEGALIIRLAKLGGGERVVEAQEEEGRGGHGGWRRECFDVFWLDELCFL